MTRMCGIRTCFFVFFYYSSRSVLERKVPFHSAVGFYYSIPAH